MQQFSAPKLRKGLHFPTNLQPLPALDSH
ncbi:protein of unknown function [Cupriavidus neocaledonicus]|uniref:Uncharacterized protein n=1 Tax=Cupriavidus neocaledonicus TaxID=1040979 RepID=A0A375H1Q3_9BURK|nr:hypothetical protein CBM2605_A60259 [Cupriavidus neocaledonicus]SPD45592.1 protein of unknown function [Cupriavidus neocaledonicus]